MLGDLIYEAEGELMNMRVISVEEGRPKIEVTILQSGLLRGTEVTNIVTYLVYLENKVKQYILKERELS